MTKEELLNSPEVRNWVKAVIKDRDTADPVDNLKDIDLLNRYFREKLDKLK